MRSTCFLQKFRIFLQKNQQNCCHDPLMGGMMKVPIKWYVCSSGKEGCVREAQEGCPSPLKSIVFEAFSEFQKLSQRGKNFFDTLMIKKKSAS